MKSKQEPKPYLKTLKINNQVPRAFLYNKIRIIVPPDTYLKPNWTSTTINYFSKKVVVVCSIVVVQLGS